MLAYPECDEMSGITSNTEFAALKWVDRPTNRRRLKPIRYLPPAE